MATFPDEAADAGRAHRWMAALDRHLMLHRVRAVDTEAAFTFTMAHPDRFSGNVRSGCVGPLRYAQLVMDPSAYEQRCRPAWMRGHHVVFLQLTGSSHVYSGPRHVRANPGDFVLLNDLSRFRIEHEGRVEKILLFNVVPASLQASFGGEAVVHRPARGDVAVLAARWVQDACRPIDWVTPTGPVSMGEALRALIGEVLHERSAAPGRVNRQAIEVQVACRLQDPSLTLASLAETFCCSVRTLHRVFGRGGDESLERYIRRQRVEACARVLRGGEAARVSLTDLALQFGFASHGHFSTVFRSHLGTTPSAYRARHAR